MSSNFSSIKGYFYRLNNVSYLIVLLPLGLFLFLYYQMQVGKITPTVQDQNLVRTDRKSVV